MLELSKRLISSISNFYILKKEEIIIDYEIKRIKIQNKKSNYFISSYGEVFSICKKKGQLPKNKSLITLILNDGVYKVYKLHISPDKRDGYVRCKLYHKGKVHIRKLHRLVAQNFIPNPKKKPEVNHLDGDKSNNRVDNLEWATRLENQRHALENGLIDFSLNSGEKCKKSKLKETQVHQICKYLAENKLTYDEIIKKVGEPCTYDMIADIYRKKTWKVISDQYTFPSIIDKHYDYKKINKEIVKEICKLIDTGKYSTKEVTNIIGPPCTFYIVADIRKGKTWVNVSKEFNFIKNK